MAVRPIGMGEQGLGEDKRKNRRFGPRLEGVQGEDHRMQSLKLLKAHPSGEARPRRTEIRDKKGSTR